MAAKRVGPRDPNASKHFSKETIQGAASSGQAIKKKTRSTTTGAWNRSSAWIRYSIMSGSCAAVNGVFAKLTTTSLTSNLSYRISAYIFGLTDPSSQTATTINLLLRGTFLVLNLLFNAMMWGLYTTALRESSSTTQVSVVNTSANFMITAILGWAVFGEEVNGRWWIGAAMLAVGNVLIGKGEEDAGKDTDGDMKRDVSDHGSDDTIGQAQSSGVSI